MRLPGIGLDIDHPADLRAFMRRGRDADADAGIARAVWVMK